MINEDIKIDFISICFSGSLTGTIEHFLMYPFDTIKTRMQTLKKHGGAYHKKSIKNSLNSMIIEEGFFSLYKGCSAIITVAIPSHAAYFSVYEKIKYFINADKNTQYPFKIWLSGICATMAHDLIVTPVDVIKQQMQLKNSKFSNPFQTAKYIFNYGGIIPFFRSYPTTVLLNIPYMSSLFLIYENAKIIFSNIDPSNKKSWIHHLFAGSLSGAIAGITSSPLDVIKTRIQTNQHYSYQRLQNIIKEIIEIEGYCGFFKGVNVRTLYCIPSASITWVVYETLRKQYGLKINPEYLI